MDSPVFKTLRIAPTTQQGGTQTIQQSIYLTHNNPCGANLLIFQEMGLTQIRYIDLKNYVDEILMTEDMKVLFENIRIKGTAYINDPVDPQKNYEYLYAIQHWAQESINKLSVPIEYYKGYKFRINVYDASGTLFFDSFYPNVTVVETDGSTGLYKLSEVELLPSFPDWWVDKAQIYKISTNYAYLAFIGLNNLDLVFSNFPRNQSTTPDTVMAIASLLVDSANTRTFGIPKYGFSAMTNLSGFGGITYNCAHFIDIRTVPDENGKTTLIESIFFRISLEEDTYYIVTNTKLLQSMSLEMKKDLLIMYRKQDKTGVLDMLTTFEKKQQEEEEKTPQLSE